MQKYETVMNWLAFLMTVKKLLAHGFPRNEIQVNDGWCPEQGLQPAQRWQ